METIETVPAALTIVLMCNADTIGAGKIATNLSGDTDTIGAIACAICGSMNPIQDSGIIQTLERVNDVDFDEYALKLLPYVKY